MTTWSITQLWGQNWKTTTMFATRILISPGRADTNWSPHGMLCRWTDPACMQVGHLTTMATALQWRHSGLDGVSNHQPHHCLLSRLFGHRSKKTSKLRVTGLCAGNSPETGEFPAQLASNAEMFPFDDVIMVQAFVLPISLALCEENPPVIDGFPSQKGQ